MLIDKTYFEHWNLIPNTNEPDPNNRTSEDLDVIIEAVEKEVLLNAFGLEMWLDFKSYIGENGLSEDAPQNYKDLVNGVQYSKVVNSVSKPCIWHGILETEPKASFLADIVYYHYKIHNNTLSAQFGEVKVDTKVGNKSSITPKVTEAYNRFVKKLNGGVRSFPNGYTMEGNPYWFINGGIDYFGIYDYFGEISMMRYLFDNKENYPLFDTDLRRFGTPIKNEFGL